MPKLAEPPPAPRFNRLRRFRALPATRARARVPRRIWSPPAHWRLLAFCLMVVLVVIAFQGFATHTIGASSEPAGLHAHVEFGGAQELLAR